MHRAVRLVVDTGLHSKGWTREQAIKFSMDNEAESEAGITTEIELYGYSDKPYHTKWPIKNHGIA
jgi:uncharacterized protein (DUF885 family)